MDKREEEEGDEGSFLEDIKYVIEDMRTTLNDSFKTKLMQNRACELLDRFFYSNLFKIYKDFLSYYSEQFNISVELQKDILSKFSILFENAHKNLADSDIPDNFEDEEDMEEFLTLDMRGINQETYENFKKDLEKISNNAFQTLLAMEEDLEFDECINCIAKFKEQIEDLGQDLKIGFDVDGASLSVNLDWDD